MSTSAPELPEWYQNYCVHTADEIAGSKTSSSLSTACASGVSEPAPDASADRFLHSGRKTDQRYKLDEQAYHASLDFLRSVFIPVPGIRDLLAEVVKSWSRGSNDTDTVLSPTHNALFLCLQPPLRGATQLQAGPAFFDAVVWSLARDCGAAVVTLCWEDIENLAEDFSRSLSMGQTWHPETGYWPKFLLEDLEDNSLYAEDPNGRKWIAYIRAAILASCAKKFGQSASKESITGRRIIIHIHEAKLLAAKSPGRNFLRVLRDIIHNEFAYVVVNVILSGSDDRAGETSPSNTDGQSSSQTLHSPRLMDVLLMASPSNQHVIFSVSPEWFPSLEDTILQDMTTARRRASTHALQKKLRRLCPTRWNEPVLQPYADFPCSDLLQGPGGDTMDPTFYQRLAATIENSSSPLSNLHLLRVILGELQDSGQNLEKWLKDNPLDQYQQPRSIQNVIQEPRSLKNVIETVVKKLKKDSETYEWECKILGNIVDPSTLDESWSDIEIDPEAKSNIVQIIGQEKCSFTVPYGLLRKGRLKGAVLYGPPGTGKTKLARILARESGLVMIHVSAAEIYDCWAGNSEKMIKAVFNLGRLIGQSIIFLDEADSMLHSRNEGHSSWTQSVVTQFLQEMDGLQQSGVSPIVLLATNIPERLDMAVLRRVPGRIFLGPPTRTVRKQILCIFTREEKLDPTVELATIARETVRYSGSDLHSLCIKAAMICETEMDTKAAGVNHPLRRRILTLKHFHAAMRQIQPTLSDECLSDSIKFAAQYDPSAIRAIETIRLESEALLAEKAAQESVGLENSASGTANGEAGLSASSTPPALYSTLDAGCQEIRLLIIRCPGWRGRRFECELQKVSLLDSPRFCALSYVWGDKTGTRDIVVNGVTVSVTRNLYNALRVATHHWLEHFPLRHRDEFRLWADAVCIDQLNVTERNQQVGLMQSIYSQAELVISSLDVGNPLTDLAIDTLNTIHNVLAGFHEQQPMSDEDIEGFEWLKRVPSLHNKGHDAGQDACAAIDYFQIEHPYFRRVWILQELVLAKTAIFICNTHSISLRRLEYLADRLWQRTVSGSKKPEFVSPEVWRWARKFQAGGGFLNIKVYDSIKERLNAADTESDVTQGWCAHFLATGALWLAATDPRDYVYGMLGLMKLDMEVDYDKSVAQVYKEFFELRLALSKDQPYFQHFLSHWSGIGFTRPDGPFSTADGVLPTWSPNYRDGNMIFLAKPEEFFAAKDAASEFRGMRKTLAFQSISIPWLCEGITAHDGVFDNIPNWHGEEPVINSDMSLTIPGVYLQRVKTVQHFNSDTEARQHGISPAFSIFCANLARRYPQGYVFSKKPILIMVLQALLFDDSRMTIGESCGDTVTRRNAFVLFMFLERYWSRCERDLLGLQVPSSDSNTAAYTKERSSSGGCGNFNTKGKEKESYTVSDQPRSHINKAYAQFQTLFFHPLYRKPPDDTTEKLKFKVLWDRGVPDFTPEALDNCAGSMESVVEDVAERIQIFSRCLWFETEDGYIGRGPPYMRVGDEVYVVKGCGIPILLRRTDRGYLHVGPCFVEGLMNGEAVNFLLEELSLVQNVQIW